MKTEYLICHMTYHTGFYHKMYIMRDNGIVRSHSYKRINAKKFSLEEAKKYVNFENNNSHNERMYFIENFEDYDTWRNRQT